MFIKGGNKVKNNKELKDRSGDVVLLLIIGLFILRLPLSIAALVISINRIDKTFYKVTAIISTIFILSVVVYL